MLSLNYLTLTISQEANLHRDKGVALTRYSKQNNVWSRQPAEQCQSGLSLKSDQKIDREIICIQLAN